MMPRQSTLIIPAHRDHPAYATCLASVAQLDPPPGEVIVVVDGNDSSTIARARGHGFHTIVLGEAPGVASARNAGAKAASGDLLVFTDSDIQLPVRFIAQAVEIFQRKPGHAAAIGSYDDQPAAPGVVSRYRNLLHHFTHQQGRADAQTFWAGCGAVRKDVFLSAGGYDARYRIPSVEDIELGYRLVREGHRIVLDPAWRVRHLKNWTLPNMIYTDLFCRAIPWSRLLRREKRMDNDLNIDTASRLSGFLVLVLLAGVAGCLIRPLYGLVSAGALGGILMLNRRFFSFLLKKGGWRLALPGIVLHLIYLICGVTGFALAQIMPQQDGLSGKTAA